MKLTSENVDTVFIDCLFDTRTTENEKTAVWAEGINARFGFHPGRLEGHRQDIIDMLAELPTQFKSWGGGGWSFLNMLDDKDGHQWTDLHARMEQLVALGLAIGKVQCQIPREMWAALPGGMPYYTIIEDAPAPAEQPAHG